MRSSSQFVGILLLASLAAAPVTAQESPLFADHQVISMRMSVDLSNLCRPREDENCTYSPSTLVYEAPDGEERSLSIEVRVRGGWRALRENCAVPPLFLRFPVEGTPGGLFAEQNVLPLSTHCRSEVSFDGTSVDFEQYVLKEYLSYRLYNLLTDKSLQARLVHMTYANPTDPSDSVQRYAFFSEHFDSLAARHNSEVLFDDSYSPAQSGLMDLNLLALFNYMIGNTDWSITRRHNVVVLRAPDGTITPVPFDMDMSGLVNAAYAAPAPNLPIDDVRRRWFLGFCRPDTDWDALFAHFQSKQDDMLQLIDDVPALIVAEHRSTTRFIEQFFGILDSPRRRQRSIVGRCQPLE